jgi:sulfhydrogenase subunit beta (sulfur reductase)
MHMIRLKKQNLEAAMATAAKGYALAGPVEVGGGHEFSRLAQGCCPDLTYTQSRLSPKALLFPQAEPMFHFDLSRKTKKGRQTPPVFLEAESFKEAPLAIIGIRPCDARALDLLKLNFDSPTYKDPFFIRRYEDMVRVGLADIDPGPGDFSLAAGSGPFDTASVDILLADAGDAYIGQVITEKGEAFSRTAGFEAGETGDAERFAAMKAAAEKQVDTSPEFDRILDTPTLDLYEADFWQEQAFSCINCGTCTFSCPTCWCFDIQDEVKQGKGVRLRLWDTCMTDLYSAHASGHNPRLEGFKRFRNRFMHKLKYFPDKYGAGIMCVGCGRCITQCPAGIDIREVMAVMNEIPAREEVAP